MMGARPGNHAHRAPFLFPGAHWYLHIVAGPRLSGFKCDSAKLINHKVTENDDIRGSETFLLLSHGTGPSLFFVSLVS